VVDPIRAHVMRSYASLWICDYAGLSEGPRAQFNTVAVELSAASAGDDTEQACLNLAGGPGAIAPDLSRHCVDESDHQPADRGIVVALRKSEVARCDQESIHGFSPNQNEKVASASTSSRSGQTVVRRGIDWLPVVTI
jgi:hypothetical protein